MLSGHGGELYGDPRNDSIHLSWNADDGASALGGVWTVDEPTSDHVFGDVRVIDPEDASHTESLFEPSARGASGVSVIPIFLIRGMATGASKVACKFTVLKPSSGQAHLIRID
ncbi:hypothetical protein GCM10011415_25590 [Salipiger pallidus]|uniref:Uncharacterized protein n=1 Tax=Salipiger pallidus TaxID=1775170 RepID=A0A8J2ZKV5_9RHOB|nr:hypothetical protein [Salipiger pallidus]GGG75833.1 hypothetical protein GCM10011415_25590 [Salipiger pallidus]